MWVTLRSWSWSMLNFSDVYIHVFIKFGKFLATISFNLSFILFSFSWTPTRHMLIYFMVYHRFLCCLPFFNLFTLYSSEIIISVVLSSSSPALYSAYENLILKPSSEFFIALTVLFSSRNFFVLFYVFYDIIGISVLSIHHFLGLLFIFLSFGSIVRTFILNY